jgi:glycosyltransferase involved in cell wall biosynthesis
LKVLQICAAYKPAFIYGGPTMSVSMLSENLVKAGIDTEVYATTANGKQELPVTPGVAVNVDGVEVTYFKRVTGDHSHYSPALFKRLRKEVKNFDLVHIHAWWNLVSVFSCLIAIRQKVPVLMSPRGTLSPYSFQNKSIGVKWFLHQFLGARLLRQCNIHTTSQPEADATATLFRPKSMTILPNFVKLPAKKVYPERPIPGRIKLIFFGRIEEKKGLDTLLNALPHVEVPYQLTIAGDGDNAYIESLKKITVDNGSAEHIDWIGFQTDNKFDLLQAQDLFILPSHDENFGNAVIESLSVGTPVLISEGVGLAEYVKDNKLGWVCAADPLLFAQQVNNIVTNEQAELERIRKIAPGIIFNDFNEEILAERYINMYTQLIKA